MKKNAFIWVVLFILTGSCADKDIIEPSTPGPSLYFRARVDSEVIDKGAGVDGYSAFSIMGGGVQRLWTAGLFPDSLEGDQIAITISNHQVPAGDKKQDLISSITVDSYPFVLSPFVGNSEAYVLLVYNDDLYESALIEQPSNSYFDIVAVKDTVYQNQLYRVADIRFSAQMLSVLTMDTITVTDAKARLAFSDREQ